MPMTRSGGRGEHTVFLTGGSGFVGRHICTALLEDGHRVVALENRSRLPNSLGERCASVYGGGLASLDLDRALDGVGVIVHAAAHIPSDFDSMGEAEACFRVNALDSLRIAQAAAMRGIRLVYISAANMYVRKSSPCEETDPVYPLGRAATYFASKLAGESLIHAATEAAGSEALMLRVGTPYGPGEPVTKVVPTFLRRAANGEPLYLVDSGRACFNFIHVLDVAKCVVAAVNSGLPGIYNVSSGESTSLKELAEAVVAAFPERCVQVRIDDGGMSAGAGFPSVSITKMQQAWGIVPMDIRTGVKLYRKQLEAESATPCE